MTNILLYLVPLLLFFSCSNSKNNADKPIEQQKSLSPEKFIPKLDKKLVEISGLMIYDKLFWGFNDSGGKNEIYGFNKKGDIKREVELDNAKNHDWESMAQDNKHIYLGDFGNNRGARHNLCIYKIKKKGLKDKDEQKVEAKKIRFSYALQDDFMYFNNTTPFDCEALVEFNGSLYIFSKNWKDFTTTVYKIPTKTGDYVLYPMETFNVNGLVTGADISPDKTQLALVGYQRYRSFVWLFTNFTGDDFFRGSSRYFKLNEIDGAQTEGISYSGNDSLLVSCEGTKSHHQQIFSFNISAINNGTH